jgi:hypothetical protein
MTTSQGSEPISDDELLYRRVPASLNLYDPISKPNLLPDAFRPNANDITGLSVYRAKYNLSSKQPKDAQANSITSPSYGQATFAQKESRLRLALKKVILGTQKFLVSLTKTVIAIELWSGRSC